MQRSAASTTFSPSRPVRRTGDRGASLSIRLSAVIVAATIDEPRMLAVKLGQEPVEALPSGPLEIEHRTLEVGLRAWVERQTSQKLGYVEQLYTFGDRDRIEGEDAGPGRALTVAYLALVREARTGERQQRSGTAGIAISLGRIGAPAGRPRWCRSKNGSPGGRKVPSPKPSGGCAWSGWVWPLPLPGMRSWCSTAMNCSTRRV